MPKQTILWTVIPNGRVPDGEFAGRLRVSIVASPRLTPQAADEQRLDAYADWVDWPATLARARFTLNADGEEIPLETLPQADSQLWTRLLPPATPVAGFVFRDMSRVNLFSFSVASVLSLTREHYGNPALNATTTHPTLLPWRNAHPGLRGLLEACGTRTEHVRGDGRERVEQLVPGLDRFFGDREGGIDRALRGQVYGEHSVYPGKTTAPGGEADGKPQAGPTFALRAMPGRWQDPAHQGVDQRLMASWRPQGEYTLFMANRFYRRPACDPAARRQERTASAQAARDGFPRHRRLVWRLPGADAAAGAGDRLRAACRFAAGQADRRRAASAGPNLSCAPLGRRAGRRRLLSRNGLAGRCRALHDAAAQPRP